MAGDYARIAARSCNRELAQGMADGTYKEVVRDRGGDVETTTWDARRDLSVKGYGIVEKAEKEMPDGIGPVRTPYAVPTEDPEHLGY